MRISSGNQPGSFDRAERWALWILVGLIALGLCGITGLASWLIAPFTPFWANWLNVAQGQVEVIAPAESQAGGILSPDGRYMVMGWQRAGMREIFVWNLATGEKLPFKLRNSGLCWLNPEQFAVLDLTNTYYVVQASNVRVMPAVLIRAKNGSSPAISPTELRARWQTADQIYALDSFGYGGYTVFTQERGQSHVYFGFK